MKVLQLSSAAEPGRRLDLHPQVTVIRGTDPAKRAWILAALAGLPQGRADGVGGIVEAHGVRFDLDAEALALLDLHAGLDVVVRPEDLPGHDPTVGQATAARRAAEQDRDAQLQRLHSARAAAASANEATIALALALDDLRVGGGAVSQAMEAAAAAEARLAAELAEARAGRQRREHELAVAVSAEGAVTAMVARAEQRVEAAREQRRRALDAATLAAAELEAARSSLDHAAVGDLEQARAQLGEIEQAAAAASDTAASGPDPDPAGQAASPGAGAAADAASSGPAAEAGTPADPTDPAPEAADQSVPAPATPPTDPFGAGAGGIVAAPPATGVGPSGSSVAARIVALEERHASLARLTVAVTTDADVGSVRAALDALHAEPDVGRPTPIPPAAVASVPAATAMALADTWRDINQQLAALDVPAPAPASAAPEASAATSPVGPPPAEAVDPVAAVEAAHARVLDAEDRADSRFGGGRARKLLDEAKAAERALLESLGFTTYADYLMTSSSGGVVAPDEALPVSPPVAASAPDVSADVAARRAELVRRRDIVAPSIAALLGREPLDEAVEADLRELAEPDSAPTSAAAPLPAVEPATALRQALESVGVSIGTMLLPPSELAELAEAWLEEQVAGQVRAAGLANEMATVEADLTRLRSGASQAPVNGRAASASASAPEPFEPTPPPRMFGARPAAWPTNLEPGSAGSAERSDETPWPAFGPISFPAEGPGAGPGPSSEAVGPGVAAPGDVVAGGAGTTEGAGPGAGGDGAPAGPAPSGAAPPDADAAARRAARLDEARSAFEAAERRVMLDRGAREQVTRLELSLDEHTAAERAAAEALTAAELELQEALDGEALAAARAAVSGAQAALAAASTLVEDLAAHLASAEIDDASGVAALIADHEARLAEAHQVEATATAEVTVTEQALAEAEHALSAAIDAEEADLAARPASSGDDLVEEIEWYLLARLAAQRAVSAAGSVPLVLDDPFRGLRGDAGVRLLARLERMASAVQVVVLSDAADLAEWARGLGPDRASVVDASGI